MSRASPYKNAKVVLLLVKRPNMGSLVGPADLAGLAGGTLLPYGNYNFL